jgi:hypothetical protein
MSAGQSPVATRAGRANRAKETYPVCYGIYVL